MKIFKNFNKAGKPCVICGTKGNGQVTLIPIDGTEDDGNIEAEQVHINCLELRYDPINKRMIYMTEEQMERKQIK